MEFLLAFNIGNSNIEMGLFREDKLITSWKISSRLKRTNDEWWSNVRNHLTPKIQLCIRMDSRFSGNDGISVDQIEHISVSSVVPHLTEQCNEMIKQNLKISPLIVSTTSCPFIKLSYTNPENIGADRLCNVFAAVHYYGAPVIVVDFGTAITINVVNGDGIFLGGSIMTGPKTSINALKKQAAQLFKVSILFPENPIGNCTRKCIQSGVTWGIIDQIDGLVKRMANELGEKPSVIACGGIGEMYAAHSSTIHKWHASLTLQGARLVYEQHLREQKCVNN